MTPRWVPNGIGRRALRKAVLLGAVAGSLLVLQASPAQAQTAGKSVAGGYLPHPSQWPWVTALIDTDFGRPTCAGTLVSPKRVLTAAHCVTGPDFDPSTLVAHVGLRSLSDQSVGARVAPSAIAVHPSYDNTTNGYFDVAVVFLSAPVAIPPAPIGTARTFAGSGTAMGWGHTNYSHNPATRVLTNDLKAVDLYLGSDSDCGRWLGRYIPALHICAYDYEGDDCVTHGDSGGPLMVNSGGWKLIGVASYITSEAGTWGPCYSPMALYTWVAGPTLSAWPLSVANPACPYALRKFKRIKRIWVKRSKQFRRARRWVQTVCTG